jgi:hypothetical protein
MTRYKNARIQAEMEDSDREEEEVKVLEEPAKSDEEEIWKKRYGDLRRAQAERDAKHKEELELKQRQLDGISSGQIKPPKSERELAEWMEKYPEFTSILDVYVSRKIDDKTKDFKVQSEEIQKEKAYIALKKRHPDLDEILDGASPIHEWLLTQKKVDQDAIYNSLDVDNADFVIEKYKMTLTKKNKKSEDSSEDSREAAKSVKVNSRAQVPEKLDGDYWFSESEIDQKGRNPRWWDANEDKIKEAQRKGKIFYDMTGGAR